MNKSNNSFGFWQGFNCQSKWNDKTGALIGIIGFPANDPFEVQSKVWYEGRLVWHGRFEFMWKRVTNHGAHRGILLHFCPVKSKYVDVNH